MPHFEDSVLFFPLWAEFGMEVLPLPPIQWPIKTNPNHLIDLASAWIPHELI